MLAYYATKDNPVPIPVKVRGLEVFRSAVAFTGVRCLLGVLLASW